MRVKLSLTTLFGILLIPFTAQATIEITVRFEYSSSASETLSFKNVSIRGSELTIYNPPGGPSYRFRQSALKSVGLSAKELRDYLMEMKNDRTGTLKMDVSSPSERRESTSYIYIDHIGSIVEVRSQ